MKIKLNENQVTNQVIDGLKLSGYRVWKIYNGGIPARAIGGKVLFRRKNDEYRGLPDLLAINPKKGHLLFIECKSSIGRASLEQLDFLSLVSSIRSVRGCVAKSFDDVTKLLV